MRIALFVTCVGDTVFPEAGRATVQVLERLGHEVVFPTEQTCCGQMHANSGYRSEARALAGDPPNPIDPPPGCHFHPRCPLKADICVTETPLLKVVAAGHRAACHFRDRPVT